MKIEIIEDGEYGRIEGCKRADPAVVAGDLDVVEVADDVGERWLRVCAEWDDVAGEMCVAQTLLPGREYDRKAKENMQWWKDARARVKL